MWTFLFFLTACALVGLLIWDYQRKSALREAASRERFEQVFKEKLLTAGHAPPETPEPARAPPAPAQPIAAPRGMKERFLNPSETLVYYLLRAGIPDHAVFAKVPLASLVFTSGTGADREYQARRLSQHHVDFVVCDRNMRVAAALELRHAGIADAAGNPRFVAETLRAAGIRMVEINAAAMPRREEIRKLVLGEPAADS